MATIILRKPGISNYQCSQLYQWVECCWLVSYLCWWPVYKCNNYLQHGGNVEWSILLLHEEGWWLYRGYLWQNQWSFVECSFPTNEFVILMLSCRIIVWSIGCCNNGTHPQIFPSSIHHGRYWDTWCQQSSWLLRYMLSLWFLLPPFCLLMVCCQDTSRRPIGINLIKNQPSPFKSRSQFFAVSDNWAM